MRKRTLFLMLVVLLTTMLPLIAAAKVSTVGVPGGPFKTTFRVQNLGAADAICSYDVYDNTGAVPNGFVTTSLDPIKPNAAAVVAVESVPNFPTGTNAAVISCSEQVAVNVMFNDANKNDAYNGVPDPSTELWIPQVFRLNGQGYQSSIRIQNASASANTGTIEYVKGKTSIATKPISLGGNGAVTLDQKDVAELIAGNAYAAHITMAQPVAAIVTVFGKPATSKENRLRAYEAFTGGTTEAVYAAALMRNYSASKYDTIINIQNVGQTHTTVTIKYVSAGTSIIRTYVVQPDATKSVKQDVETSLPTDKVFAAKITSIATLASDPNGAATAQPIIVTVDEVSEFYSRDSTYKAAGVGGTKIAVPYVLKHYKGYNSSVTCQNVGATTITGITATYYRVKSDGTVVPTNSGLVSLGTGLKPGKTEMLYQPSESDAVLPDSGIASMIITVTATDPQTTGVTEISCVANVDQTDGDYRTQQKDRLAAYNGVVMAP
jgi:hypothetical protein